MSKQTSAPRFAVGQRVRIKDTIARLCFGSTAVQGFEPTEILVRKVEGLTLTV